MRTSNLDKRKKQEKRFHMLCKSLTWMSLVVLVILLTHVSVEGFSRLSLEFINSFPSRFAHKAGLKSALWGSVWLMGMVFLISVPLGVASAIYLEEYNSKSKISRLIEINISNLAGVPSVVYGILGLAIFVRFFGLDRSLLAGSMTMSLLILPVIIIASREALRTIPRSIRLGSLALGTTTWQTIWHHVLPPAVPGILTGIILALSLIHI